MFYKLMIISRYFVSTLRHVAVKDVHCPELDNAGQAIVWTFKLNEVTRCDGYYAQ